MFRKYALWLIARDVDKGLAVSPCSFARLEAEVSRDRF